MTATPPARTRVVVNPSVAGATRRLARVHSMVDAAWSGVDWCTSRSAQHLVELCGDAVANGFARVVVAGGDGSVHFAIRALAHSHTALGILPLGTGNDFAMAAGIPLDLEAAARIATSCRAVPTDLGTAGGIPFCCIAGIGMDTAALHFIQRSRIRPKKLLYQVAAVRTLLAYEAPRMRIEISQGILEQRVVFAAVANTPTYAGGNRLAPAASIFDGQLDYCFFFDQPRGRRLQTFWRVKRGVHVGRPGVLCGSANTVHVDGDPWVPVTLDGELTELRTPIEIGILPGAVDLICPGGAA